VKVPVPILEGSKVNPLEIKRNGDGSSHSSKRSRKKDNVEGGNGGAANSANKTRYLLLGKQRYKSQKSYTQPFIP
jgi:hypothetical protein